MRTSKKQVGCAILAMMCALLGAPSAHADEVHNANFVAEANALGLTRPDDFLIRLGLSTCRMLQPHLRRLPMDVEAHIARSANLEPATIPPPGRDTHYLGDLRQREFMVLAVRYYCPHLTYRLSE